MRKTLIAVSIALGAPFSASPGHAETLNLLIWESYIDQKILDRWTEKSGVAVNQIYYDSGDARDEVLADPNSNIDLVVVGENGAELFGKRGILEPLTEKNVPSLKDYQPQWTSRCAGYAMPYLWGTIGHRLPLGHGQDSAHLLERPDVAGAGAEKAHRHV